MGQSISYYLNLLLLAFLPYFSAASPQIILSNTVSSQTDFGAGHWTYEGTDGTPFANSGTDLLITGSGYYNYNAFPEHMLGKFAMKLKLGTNASPTGKIGIGIRDNIEDNPNPVFWRNPIVWIDCSTSSHVLQFIMEGGVRTSSRIPASFNFTGAELKIDFEDDILFIVLIDHVNNYVISDIWRYCLKQRFDNGSIFYHFGVPGHQTNPPGFFTIGAASSSNWVISNLEISTKVSPDADFVFTGHSISAGRQSFPTTNRYSDRLKDTFAKSGTPKIIENFSSGGLTTPALHHTINSIVRIFAGRTGGLPPPTVVIFIGANDNTNDLTTWIPGLIQIIDTLTGQGIRVACMNYSYYPADTNAHNVADYFLNVLPGLVAHPSLFRVNDAFYNDYISYPSTPRTGIVNAVDGVHRTIYGNQVLSDELFAWFATNPFSSSYDADAQTFLTAASITDPTISLAVDSLVVQWKRAGLWTKAKAAWPIVGGNSVSHSYNLINPAAYQITWVASPTHSAAGVTFDGGTQYANTNFNTSSGMGTDVEGAAVIYCTTTTGNFISFGSFVNGSSSAYTYLQVAGTGYLRLNSESYGINGISVPASGYILVNRPYQLGITGGAGWGLLEADINGTYTQGNTGAGNDIPGIAPNAKEFIGAISNSGGTPVLPGAMTLKLYGRFLGLTPTERTALRTSIIAFETTLSRL